MSVNKVILVGNVGKDPEMKYFDNDVALANFSLATSERGYTTSSGTEVPERTEWHNIVCWRGLAKVAENYVKKGTQLYIEGKIRTRSYDDQNGVKKYITEIVADNLELLGRKPSESGERGSYQPESDSATTQVNPSNRKSSTNDIDPISETDDLPF